MKIKEELKRCPFCGGFPILQYEYSKSYNRYLYFVICQVCSAQCGATPFDDIAVVRWNERVQE